MEGGNIMKINIESYEHKYKEALGSLIEDDDFVKADILNCVEAWPDCAMVVVYKDEIVAVGVFGGSNETTSMTFYVKPERRKEGIGTTLLKALEDKMVSAGVKKVVCDFKGNKERQQFLYKRGYNPWFYSNLMIYEGGKLPTADYDVKSYEDKDYGECERIFSHGFHKMRLSMGLESKLSEPSEDQRKSYRENKENIFVLRENDEIIAVSRIDGCELDSVAVKIDKQGRGFGRHLVSYSVNQILHRGYSKVNLWVVEGNQAKALYEKLGFKVHRLHEFVIKPIS